MTTQPAPRPRWVAFAIGFAVLVWVQFIATALRRGMPELALVIGLGGLALWGVLAWHERQKWKGTA